MGTSPLEIMEEVSGGGWIMAEITHVIGFFFNFRVGYPKHHVFVLQSQIPS